VLVTDADGLERLALFVTATGPAEEAERAAEFACERALPRYKRPTWIRAVPELPRTATGKIQRYRLRETLERDITNPVSTKSAEDPGTVALPALGEKRPEKRRFWKADSPYDSGRN
jgi:acyl-CoA synthetase (AMP-forming)/AMP-acid ligase II